MMALRKQIVSDATSKGKVVVTIRSKTFQPISNQLHIDDIDSISPQKLFVDVQPPQQWEDQLLETLYEMREQMKEQ